MKGMVDSFNVSVAAGILMHHAVCDRASRLVITVAVQPAAHHIVRTVSFWKRFVAFNLCWLLDIILDSFIFKSKEPFFFGTGCM